MAELAGLVVGAVSLTALFSTCIESFEYIQLGRNFGVDYERCLLRLDIVRLRLSRWGESVKITADANDVRYEVALASHEDQETVKNLLNNIVGAFDEAKRRSDKFKLKAKSQDDLQAMDNRGDLTVQSMLKAFNSITLRRQKGTRFIKKVAWALYEKKTFDHLINSVNNLVEELVDLFPSVHGYQEKLCEMEISEVTTGLDEQRSLPLLKDTASDLDDVLEKVVTKVIEKSSGHSYGDMSAIGKSSLIMGDHIRDAAQFTGRGSHTYEKVRTADNARVQAGDIFGGPSIFDRPRSPD